MSSLRVLLVEDSPSDAKLVIRELERSGLTVESLRVETAPAMREALASRTWDVILSDWRMPTFSGAAALALVKETRLDVPFIIVSGTVGEENAVAAMREGAADFVLKDKLSRLAPAVEREIREQEQRRAHREEQRRRAATERRIQQMVDSAMVGFWFLDAEGKTTFMNDYLAHMLGLEPSEKNEARASDFVDPEVLPDMAQRLAQRKAGIAGRYEQRFRRKDGSYGWAIVESSSIYDPEGRFDGILSIVTDISARHRMEEELREAELRFRRLFETGIIGITVAERGGKVLEANDTFLEMVGYSREDVAAGRIDRSVLTPAEFAASSALAAKSVAENGRASPWEKAYRRKDGSLVPVLVGLAALDDRRVLSIAIDLTERARAEERTAAVVDAALDAVIIMSAEGTITAWNPAAEKTFGFPRAEAVGRELAETIVPFRVRDQHARGLARYRAGGGGALVGKRVELTAVRAGGDEFPVELSISRMGDESSPSFVGFVRDISERKRVESELLERMQAAALGGDVGVALTASDTLEGILGRCCEAVVAHLKAAFARIWTLDKSGEVLELRASAGMYTHTDGAHARLPVGKLKIGLIASQRKPHWTNDAPSDPHVANQAWARQEGLKAFAGLPLLVGGEIVGVLAMFSRHPVADVTMRALSQVADVIAVRIQGKLAEEQSAAFQEQLRQAQKMEAIGLLAGGVAHDFNNLLSVILSYSELLLDDLPAGNAIREDIEEIHHAGERAAELTRQLLLMSRQQIVEAKVLDVGEVVAEMDKMVRRLVGEDVQLIASLPRSLGRVFMDRGSLEQVVMNLVVNARDAMPAGGTIMVEAANVTLDREFVRTHLGAKPGDYVLLSVSDTGSGMDKTTIARIFEPFFTTKKQGKGTGLGLSTVFGIVKQSGGSIWVYSELGLGTTFKIYLPRVDRVADEAPVEPQVRGRSGNETVLLVEDEAQVREVARGILARHGYTVLCPETAEDAQALCEQHSGAIHLLLTDVVMPRLGGPELARRLVAVRPNMRVLFMSGYTDNAALLHEILEKGFAYLQKPLTVETLLRKVREVIGRQEAFSERGF